MLFNIVTVYLLKAHPVGGDFSFVEMTTLSCISGGEREDAREENFSFYKHPPGVLPFPVQSR